MAGMQPGMNPATQTSRTREARPAWPTSGAADEEENMNQNQNQTAKTIISEDVEISGSIKCVSNVELNGKLNGDLTCGGSVLIGGTATVKGNVTVESVLVHGQVTGNIIARDRIDLKPTARITGDIKARRLTVEDGVMFVGKSEINPNAAAGAGSRASAADSKGGMDDSLLSGGDESDDSPKPLKPAPAFFGKK